MTSVNYEIEPDIEVNGVRIIPVVKTCVSYNQSTPLYFSAYKQPVIIIVITGPHIKIFRITGEEMDLNAFFHEFPGQAHLVDRFL
jgi:hypothetical protein